jgi:hypothetical protein
VSAHVSCRIRLADGAVNSWTQTCNFLCAAVWLGTDAALPTVSAQLAHTLSCCQRLQDSRSSGRSRRSGGCPEPVKRVFAENGTAHDADAPDGAASPSRWMQADAAEPDIGSERDITRLGESVVKVGAVHPNPTCQFLGARTIWSSWRWACRIPRELGGWHVMRERVKSTTGEHAVLGHMCCPFMECQAM